MKLKSLLLVCFLIIQNNALSSQNNNFSYNYDKFSKKSQQQIQIAEEYLNSIKNLSANFIQTDESGNFQKGTFYLSRPGKMRWEYMEPQEILIVINNKDMVHFDKKLDQVSYFCSRNEFINLLTQEDINFRTDQLFVKNLNYNKNMLKIILGKKDSTGTLSMVFKKAPFQIQKLTIIDESQEQLDITLFDIDHPETLQSAYFEFTDHKYMRKKRY